MNLLATMHAEFTIEGPLQKAASRPVIVLLVKRNWAELDAGLPVLHAFSRARQDIPRVALFQDARMHQQREQFPALVAQLKRLTDVCVWAHHDPSSSFKLKRNLPSGERQSGIRHASLGAFWRVRAPLLAMRELRLLQHGGLLEAGVCALIRNHKAETPLERCLRKRNPDALKVSFHHGAHPTVAKEERASQPRPGRGAPTDLFLAKTPEEADLVRFPGRQPSVQAVGLLKYDAQWLERITDSSTAGDQDEPRSAHNRRTWLFLTRGPVNEAMDTADYGRLIEALAKSLIDRPDVRLLVKPHPREDLELLRASLPGREGERWCITHQHPYVAARQAELAIAMWSSVILDAAAADKPVIELYRFRYPNHYLAYLPGGRLGSTHAALGICEPASTHEELENAIKAWEDRGWHHPTWSPKRRAVAALLGSTPGSILQRTTDVIEETMQSYSLHTGGSKES